MIPPDPLAAYQNAPLGDLLAILLRQFRRPLKGQGVDLTDAEAEAIAHDLVQHDRRARKRRPFAPRWSI